MKSCPLGYWLAWITGSIVCVAIAVACSETDKAKPVAEKPAAEESPIEHPMVENPVLFAAPDHSGVYIVVADGFYLVRGNEAIRVKEVPAFSPPSSRPTQ